MVDKNSKDSLNEEWTKVEREVNKVEQEVKKKNAGWKVALYWVIGIFIFICIVSVIANPKGFKEGWEAAESASEQSKQMQEEYEASEEIKKQEARETKEREEAAAAERAAKAEAERVQHEQSIANAAQSYSYDDLFRNSANYKGSYIHFTGAIIQTNSYNSYCRVATQKLAYIGYFENELYVSPCESNSTKLLDGDIITFVGIADGTYNLYSVAELELPKVKAVSSTMQVIGKN